MEISVRMILCMAYSDIITVRAKILVFYKLNEGFTVFSYRFDRWFCSFWLSLPLMKTEFQKMRSEELYDFSDAEINQSAIHAKEACLRLNRLSLSSPDYREALQDLIPGIPDSTCVCPPFHCDHGNGIIMGENTFLNYNCVILDGATVTIGNDVKIGPGCQLVTPQHPIDYAARRGTCETSYPIEVGDDTWLGAGVIVCPGVKIGKRCIIAAGSVVIRDIPDDSMAAGNPAVVKKSLR